MNIEKILGDYKNGDEDKRLSLFLAYRDLRDEFSRIDQDQDNFQFSGLLSQLFSFNTA